MFPAILLEVILVLLVVGVLLWGLSQIPAIDPAIRQIIRVVIIVIVAIWLIYLLFGLIGTSPGPMFPRSR
jgi:hypothetical protein